ncbi:hypothetical protein [Bullifex porci]|uniref:hypothetical protein n=1 Tax=Bullifex porci TaxID=2606638 RepID=UPI0023F0F253|nr:hypothetical protein [Bullifex porci]MDD7254801.1 hypothetical protein [Bullifex porci]MDY2741236.1 hypothetical protein [Bullifex porci]
MRYEEFLESFLASDKTLKETIKKLSGLEGKMQKDTIKGDVRSLLKNLEAMKNAVTSLDEALNSVDETISNFDYRSYFVSGEFTEDMLLGLKNRKMDTVGEYPVFEVFPTRIRIDAENQEVILGKKKVPTMRPQVLVDSAADLVDKLESALFNAQSFAQDLENAYSICVLQEKAKNTGKVNEHLYYIPLLSCYKVMVPLSRSRKDYDEMAFAFDLARLYNAIKKGDFVTKSGHTCLFGTGRGKSVRILDDTGMEQLISTICFR